MVAIETHDPTKQYGTVLAVDDLSLSIPEGVVYGVLGPNGAGKTTMMRMLTTLTKPNQWFREGDGRSHHGSSRPRRTYRLPSRRTTPVR